MKTHNDFPSDFINPFTMLKLVASSFGKKVAIYFSEQRSLHVLSILSAIETPVFIILIHEIMLSYPWPVISLNDVTLQK